MKIIIIAILLILINNISSYSTMFPYQSVDEVFLKSKLVVNTKLISKSISNGYVILKWRVINVLYGNFQDSIITLNYDIEDMDCCSIDSGICEILVMGLNINKRPSYISRSFKYKESSYKEEINRLIILINDIFQIAKIKGDSSVVNNKKYENKYNKFVRYAPWLAKMIYNKYDRYSDYGGSMYTLTEELPNYLHRYPNKFLDSIQGLDISSDEEYLCEFSQHFFNDEDRAGLYDFIFTDEFLKVPVKPIEFMAYVKGINDSFVFERLLLVIRKEIKKHLNHNEDLEYGIIIPNMIKMLLYLNPQPEIKNLIDIIQDRKLKIDKVKLTKEFFKVE